MSLRPDQDQRCTLAFAGQGQEEVSRLVPGLLREADGGQEGGGRAGGRRGGCSRSVGGLTEVSRGLTSPDLDIVVAAVCFVAPCYENCLWKKKIIIPLYGDFIKLNNICEFI